MHLKSVVNLNKLCILKLSEYQNKLKESCSQVRFPQNSRRFDEPVVCESRDEFCACMIEN